MVAAGEILDGHVALDIECLDRVYLNAYEPILQFSGQVVACYLNVRRDAVHKAVERA